jgi:hypothetical protein
MKNKQEKKGVCRMITDMQKLVLLVRMNVAWSLSAWRPIDLEPVGKQAWMVTYQHHTTGEIQQLGLLKSELDRTERNNGGGSFRLVISAQSTPDGVVLFSRWQRVKRY